ncbi:polysaccharide biosynthesis C-terminal domain-containing protein [Fibrobacter sp.]|uniref:oligosaccharide flippase family protein n=1 Tax=Fibrobacter sp. TaxID=35828 RepID=UPI00388DD1D7
MLEKYRILLKNIMLIFFGNFGSKILVFVMLPFYTSVLSTEEFGVSDLIFSTTNLLFPVFTLLASEFAFRFAADKGIDKKIVFSCAISVSIVGTVLLFVAAPFVGRFFSFGSALYLFFLYYTTHIFYSIVTEFVKGLNHIKLFSVCGVLNTFFIAGLNIVFLYFFHFGVTGYVIAYSVSPLVLTFFLFFKLKLYRYLSIMSRKEWKNCIPFFAFTIPMIPNSLSWWLNNSIDRYMLVYWCGIGVIGVYAAAYRIPSFLTTVCSIFLSAWQVSAYSNADDSELSDFFNRVYRQYSSFVILAAAGIIFFEKKIAQLLLSNDFYEAWKFASILIFAYVFQSMAGFLGSVYTTKKKTKWLFVSTAIGGLMNVLLNFVLIPKFAAVGAAIATAGSFFCVWFIRLVHIRFKIMKLNPSYINDCVSYALLLLMVYFISTKEGTFFYINICIVVALLLLNHKILWMVLKQAKSLIKRRSNV